MKRLALSIALVAVAVVVTASLVFRQIADRGSSKVEQWIGEQIISIANSYLNPRLEFSDLDYEYPSTVNLKNLRLVAIDPADPHKTIDIFASDDATLTLAEIPQVGKPIVIERIILNRPLFQAVSVEPNSKRFVGFSQLIRIDDGVMSPARPSSGESSSPPKLSDVFQIRLIQLNQGRIVYDPRIPNTVPMEIDQINTTLNVQPDAAGTYKLQTAILREPVFDLHVACRLDIDTFRADELRMAVRAALGREHDQFLPPQLQKLLRDYEVKGVLEARINGQVAVADYLGSKLSLDLNISDANVSIDKYRIPIDRLELRANLEDRKILQNVVLRALHGEANIDGTMTFDELLSTTIALSVSNMEIGELLRRPGAAAETNVAGTISAKIQAEAPLRVVLAKLNTPATQPAEAFLSTPLADRALPTYWGEGRISLDRARLVNLPIVSTITGAIARATSMVMGGGGRSDDPRERADISFTLVGESVHLEDIQYVGDVVAARGSGTVTFDQQLDLTLNAGPLERMERFLGGTVGGAIGRFSSSIASYRVTGPMRSPKIQVVTGQVGTAAKDAARGVEGAAKRTIRGIERLGEKLGGRKGGNDDER